MEPPGVLLYYSLVQQEWSVCYSWRNPSCQLYSPSVLPARGEEISRHLDSLLKGLPRRRLREQKRYGNGHVHNLCLLPILRLPGRCGLHSLLTVATKAKPYYTDVLI